MPSTPPARPPRHGPPAISAEANPQRGAASAPAVGPSAGLPPYSGPGGRCPKCQVPGAASTQWHWAAWALAPQGGGPAPACGESGLLGTPVDGEHLCRQCTTCGHGWAEATAAPVGGARGCLAPAPAVLLIAFAGSLAAVGTGIFASLLLSGAALVAAWLGAAAVTALVTAAGYANHGRGR